MRRRELNVSKGDTVLPASRFSDEPTRLFERGRSTTLHRIVPLDQKRANMAPGLTGCGCRGQDSLLPLKGNGCTMVRKWIGGGVCRSNLAGAPKLLRA